MKNISLAESIALYFNLTPAVEHWMIHWYTTSFLRPHLFALVANHLLPLCTAEDSVEPLISSRSFDFLTWILKSSLFAGETDLPRKSLVLQKNLLEKLVARGASTNELARAKFFQLFSEAYYGRRALDNMDLCRSDIEAAIAVCNAPETPSAITFYEQHYALVEDISVCFQEDDWVEAKKKVIRMRKSLFLFGGLQSLKFDFQNTAFWKLWPHSVNRQSFMTSHTTITIKIIPGRTSRSCPDTNLLPQWETCYSCAHLSIVFLLVDIRTVLTSPPREQSIIVRTPQQKILNRRN